MWAFSKKDTRDIHTGWWSLVNSMARSTYVALYKAVMNINEDSRQPHGWHSLEGDRCIKHDTPTHNILKDTHHVVNLIYFFQNEEIYM